MVEYHHNMNHLINLYLLLVCLFSLNFLFSEWFSLFYYIIIYSMEFFNSITCQKIYPREIYQDTYIKNFKHILIINFSFSFLFEVT